MPPEIDSKLEAIINQELRKLPPIAAPKTLVPRVMTAIQARAIQPWWRQSCWNWPLVVQAAFLLSALAIASLMGSAAWWFGDDVNVYSQQAVQELGAWSAFWQLLESMGIAIVLLWQKIAQPLLVYVLVASLILYLLCLSVGTVFVRFAFKRC